MNNKNFIMLGSLIIGVALGYFVGVNRINATYETVPNGMHMMQGGHMMNNVSMGTMEDTMNGMMSSLQGKTGDAFDKAFLSEMIMHHEGAVMMAKAALRDAKHPELKNMANDIISAQTKEIEQMKNWQKVWYNQ